MLDFLLVFSLLWPLFSVFVQVESIQFSQCVDRFCFDADPDSTLYFDADPDPGDPTEVLHMLEIRFFILTLIHKPVPIFLVSVIGCVII
jgi:hypothetical protein